MNKLTHLDSSGQARMVDVSDKNATRRLARAASQVRMKRETLDAIMTGQAAKGDVLAAARLAGIMAAKKCHELIPLCHPLALGSVEIEITEDANLPGLKIEAIVTLTARTGAEMEALTAASVSALTIYDMAKSLQKDMEIGPTFLLAKEGGKSGDWKKANP